MKKKEVIELIAYCYSHSLSDRCSNTIAVREQKAGSICNKTLKKNSVVMACHNRGLYSPVRYGQQLQAEWQSGGGSIWKLFFTSPFTLAA